MLQHRRLLFCKILKPQGGGIIMAAKRLSFFLLLILVSLTGCLFVGGQQVAAIITSNFAVACLEQLLK